MSVKKLHKQVRKVSKALGMFEKAHAKIEQANLSIFNIVQKQDKHIEKAQKVREMALGELSSNNQLKEQLSQFLPKKGE